MAVTSTLRQTVAVTMEAMVTGSDSYLSNSTTNAESGMETCSTDDGNSTEESEEVCIQWRIQEAGGGGGAQQARAPLKFEQPCFPPPPRGGGGGYSDLVPTGVCRWSRQTRTHL